MRTNPEENLEGSKYVEWLPAGEDNLSSLRVRHVSAHFGQEEEESTHDAPGNGPLPVADGPSRRRVLRESGILAVAHDEADAVGGC